MSSEKYVYLDITIGQEKIGRIVIELFTNLAPKTSVNILQLCQSKAYKSTIFHRIIKNFMVQCGDTTNGKTSSLSKTTYPPSNLGKGGESIYKTEENSAGEFEDENLNHPVDHAFLVCMANSGKPDTNTSQFFISTFASPHLTGAHTVFGKVIKGKSVVRQIERVTVLSNKSSDGETAWTPAFDELVVITDCGEWVDGDPTPVFNACYDTIGGDHYEEYPDDNDIEGLDLEKGEATYKISNLIKESGSLLFKQKRLEDAVLKYKKSLRYCNELIPDKDSDETYHNKFLELKKKLYLNLSLVSLQLKNYQSVVDYCGFLLELGKEVKLTNLESSKALYRLGQAYSGLKKYQEGLEFLKNADLLSPGDAVIQKEIANVENVLKETKKSEREKYSKFFG